MKSFWFMAATASCLTFSGSALSRAPATASCTVAGHATANGARACSSPDDVRPTNRPMSGTGKALCAMLLGCMLFTGNLAARRRAPRVVFS